ncbi:MAG: response regulator [Deltaproteobacteria bacterium]|nr:MAG: response regulator [Deltaproteobacteria bacterium]
MKKILVVDNHPVIVKFLSNLLEREGHQVLTAGDGLSALDVLKTYIPDVIFIDLVIPNISGDKLCRIIRSMPKLNDVYLIILSAIAAEEEVDFAEFGANACIAKGPFNKMGQHVLAALNQSDKGDLNGLSGRVIGLEDVYQRNITKELISSRRHFEVILSNMSEGILELTLEAKIVYANPTAISLIGIPEEKLLASNFTELFSRTDRERIKSLLEEMGDTPQTISENSPMILNGKQVSLNILPVKDEENESITIILNDVTERKRMEAQLQRAQKMEAIGTLAGGVAHDLNNILSGLVSYPELILTDLPEDSPLRKPILTIKNSGEKAATIVQDLLTLARRGVSSMEVVNLNDIINEYLKSPEHEKLKLFHPDVQLETYLEEDLLNILGSPVHLSKAIMNLVSNAAESMPGGGKVSISTQNRYIDGPIRGYDNVAEGDYTTLTVSDTGIGISPEDMESIFEPFYTKKTMGRSGTGLGMAVVWGTVKDHEGYIDVKSAKGKGTIVILYFPVSRKELTKKKPGLSIEDYMGKGESVLVVDDVEEQREIASRILKRLSYSVTSVSSGEEAVDYMKGNSASLLLLDMIMDPGIDGLETYKRILELHPNQKAIIVSGFSETERVKEAQRLGAGAFVKKPYLLEKIGIAVRGELER